MIKYAEVFDMRLIGHVLHDFTYHTHFGRFSYAYCLPCDILEIMPIMCPEFDMQAMSSKFALFDWYMYQNKKME